MFKTIFSCSFFDLKQIVVFKFPLLQLQQVNSFTNSPWAAQFTLKPTRLKMSCQEFLVSIAFMATVFIMYQKNKK